MVPCGPSPGSKRGVKALQSRGHLIPKRPNTPWSGLHAHSLLLLEGPQASSSLRAPRAASCPPQLPELPPAPLLLWHLVQVAAEGHLMVESSQHQGKPPHSLGRSCQHRGWALSRRREESAERGLPEQQACWPPKQRRLPTPGEQDFSTFNEL